MRTRDGPDFHLFAPDGRSVIVDVGRAPRIWYFHPLPDPPSPSGHKDEAWAAAYTPDGKILATGSDDTDEPQTIKLWDPATGRLIRGWNGGEGTVASLPFLPTVECSRLGHLTPRDNVKLWDVETGKLLHTLRGHEQAVRSVALAPDGKTLATAGGKRGKRAKTSRSACGMSPQRVVSASSRTTPTPSVRSHSRPTGGPSSPQATIRRFDSGTLRPVGPWMRSAALFPSSLWRCAGRRDPHDGR